MRLFERLSETEATRGAEQREEKVTPKEGAQHSLIPLDKSTCNISQTLDVGTAAWSSQAASLQQSSGSPAPAAEQSISPFAGLGTSQRSPAISPTPAGSVTTALGGASVPDAEGRDAAPCAALASPLLLLCRVKEPPKPRGSGPAHIRTLLISSTYANCWKSGLGETPPAQEGMKGQYCSRLLLSPRGLNYSSLG